MGRVMFNIGMTVEGVDLSASVRAVQLTEFVEERGQIGVGAAWQTFVAGPRGGQLEVEWKANYDHLGVYRTLRPLLGKIARVKVWPYGGAVTASNPEHEFDVLISNLPDINGAFGQLSTIQTSWPVSGPIISRPGPYWSATMTVDSRPFGTGDLFGFQVGVFGSMTDRSIEPTPEGPTNFVPDPGVNNNVDIVRIYFNRVAGDPDDAFEIRFASYEDAFGIRGDFLVAGELILPLSPPVAQGIEYYRSSAANPVDDPGWQVGDEVRIEFWNGDPR